MTDAIDIVIPWVDGNDPVHTAKRLKHTTENEGNLEDVGGSSRFSSIGEIFYCILSINRFARFVRKIFIVTDGQDPHIGEELSAMLPKGMIPMEIVDHKVIFRGYEEYLPTFNSRAIAEISRSRRPLRCGAAADGPVSRGGSGGCRFHPPPG